MNDFPPLLTGMYQTPRDPQTQELAARHAPVLYFDANEPFLPIAAGYTIFTEDGRSDSMERNVCLKPEGLPPASTAIEYAIWWDWDIHHLYELEHAWVYLDEQGQAARVEASWHGDFHEMPLRLEDGRAALFSEPGKHAFAPDPGWFRERWRRYRRSETGEIGAHASVLVNGMFAGKIRQRVHDRTLARSYLSRAAFEPAWDFSQRFTFQPEWLVPWPVLREWIPNRVNAWLEHLETVTSPVDTRPLRLAACVGSPDSLTAAARSGAHALLIAAHAADGRVRAGSDSGAVSLEGLFDFCRSEPVGAVFQPQNAETAERLAAFVKANGLESYAAILSDDPGLLERWRAELPGSLVIRRVESTADPLAAAKESGAQMICLPEDAPPGLSAEWLRRAHQAGLGVMAQNASAPGADIVLEGGAG